MADDDVKEARDAFDECVNAERDNRRDALDDIKFARLGEQWPDAIKRQRELEGRPTLTINKLAPIIRQVVNDSRQNKPSISVHPIDDEADVETAKVISGLIRNIEATSDADIAYDTAVDCAVSGGFGYWKVNIDQSHDDTFDQDLVIRRVANPFSVYGDPRSTAADSSDWEVAFEVESYKKAAFKRKFAGADAVDWEGLDWKRVGAPWLDGEDVQVASWWTRAEVEREIVGLSDGTVMAAKDYAANKDMFDALMLEVVTSRMAPSWKVTQRIVSGCEVLKTTDWVGRYIPIIPVYGDEVNVEGTRYFRSLIRDAKDPARMVNYWRTTATEVVALAPRTPFIGRKGAFETDAAKWATANSASHAFIEYDGQEAPARQPFASVASGMIQEALNAADDIKAVTGIYDASLGARSNETSGRAILARQREGDVSTFHFIDNLARAIRHTGRILIDLIPHVYSTERVVRVLGEDGTPEAKRINAPEGPAQGDMGDDRAEQANGAKEALYNLTVGKYDVTVTSGPSFTTRREEAATQMMELVRSFPDAAPLIGDLIAKNLDWPGADEIAERMKKMLPAAAGDDDENTSPEMQALQTQMQEMQGALQQAGEQIKANETDKALEARKLDIAEYDAETKRITAMSAGMTPEAVQAIVTQMLTDVLDSHGLEMSEPGELTAPILGDGRAMEPQGQPEA